ncbi:MAG: AAA family ATPase [Gammaproteobacteria bacterium]|jgi:chromosome partitioning protein|nr:AAA family ATPase [Gammaproteobacteria bacterium]MBT4606526.1 AAA family ATPase [Thiotrichales bacterium]MBT4329731.1 AAA family ATPase [Gammaproteobacteria bacterium]MBT5370180.1 AAA family ATPase [Gammaproteobacteria bacterium]MBT5744730.1 AAA family ATPase [Gammaproteobacteria bacterium]
MSVVNKLEENAERAEVLIQRLHSAAAGGEKKSIAPLPVTKAAAMVGCTPTHVRNLIKRDELSEDQHYISQVSGQTKYLITLEGVQKIRELSNHVVSRPTGTDGIIISCANLKGGVGKTVTNVNLAQYAAREGFKVLLVDGDPQATATGLFDYVPDRDIEGEETAFPSMVGDVPVTDIKNSIRKTYWYGLDLIPACLDLQNVDYILANPQRQAELGGDPLLRLREGLEPLTKEYDLIIVDSPPSMGMLAMNVIMAANYLIIPVAPTVIDASSTGSYFSILSTIGNLRSQNGDDMEWMERINVLLTRHSGTAEDNNTTALLFAAYGDLVMTNHIVETKEIRKGANDVKSLYEIDAPRGSRQTWLRAITSFDSVFEEIMKNCSMIWRDRLFNNQSESQVEATGHIAEAING